MELTWNKRLGHYELDNEDGEQFAALYAQVGIDTLWVLYWEYDGEEGTIRIYADSEETALERASAYLDDNEIGLKEFSAYFDITVTKRYSRRIKARTFDDATEQAKDALKDIECGSNFPDDSDFEEDVFSTSLDADLAYVDEE